MDTKGIIATIIGIIVLFVFGFFAVYLTKHTGLQQTEWDRLVYVFGGIEAVAFAAAGYFFGKEVHRERAEKAENKAANAEDAAKKDHGKTLVAETKFSSLVKYINANVPRSTIQFPDLSDLVKLANRSGIDEKAPELMEAIKDKHKTTATVPDERWNTLAKFARSL